MTAQSLKKNIYTYIKNASAPPPRAGPGSPFLQGAGERAMGQGLFSHRHMPSSLHIPCLQFQRRGSRQQAPLEREGSSPSFHTPPLKLGCRYRGRLTDLFGTPTHSQAHCPCQNRKCRRVVGRSSPEVAQSDGCPPWRVPRADVSEASESWPGLLQPLPPTIFCLKKKERKKVGGGQGTEHGGETKAVGWRGGRRWG